MIDRSTVEDCISSWLTATGFINRDEFVIFINHETDIFSTYAVHVENIEK